MFSDAFIDELIADGAQIGYAAEIDFPDGITRAHTGLGDIIINSEIFQGVGELGGVGQAVAQSDEKPGSIDVSINGLPGSILNSVTALRCRGRPAALFVVAWDKVTGKVKRYETLLAGTITNYSCSLGSKNAVTVSIGDKFELFERTIGEKWSDESHQSLHAGDRICRFVSDMKDREFHWGSATDAVPFQSS